MPFEQYIETLDPVLMHAGENAPHAYFISFDADQDARRAGKQPPFYAAEWAVGV